MSMGSCVYGVAVFDGMLYFVIYERQEDSFCLKGRARVKIN